jgi:uncharacterized membrane protein YidH (DUF202 family)
VPIEYEGGCACRRVRYGLTAPPMFVHCCHCLRCQCETGSAFVLNALIETERMELIGSAPAPVSVPTDSGRPHRIFRCEECEIAVWSEYGGVAKLRFVRIGTLDDPHALEPDVHIERTFLAWVRTSLSLLGLGFAVAKFDVWMRRLGGEVAGAAPSWGTPIGLFMIACGAALAILAAVQYHLTNRRIARGDVRPNTWLAIAVLVLVVALSAVVFVYALHSERTH